MTFTADSPLRDAGHQDGSQGEEDLAGRLPQLERFNQQASGPNTIGCKIGEIIDLIDGLPFRSQAEKHELSMLYEEKSKPMGDVGRNGGEYDTPGPLIRAIVQVVNPQIAETVYDPAVESVGSLCEVIEFMSKASASGREFSTADLDTLQKRTFT